MSTKTDIDNQITYNGWTNRATWLVPLHFENYFDDMIRDEIEINDGDKDKALQNIRESIENTVNEIYDEEIAKITNPFIIDLVDKDYINFTEIAENLSQDIFKEWFEEKITEINDTLDTLKDDTNADRYSK